MRKLVLLLGIIGLTLTSCAPPEGCFYKTYRSFEFGETVTYRERVNIFGELIVEESVRPLSRTFTICSIDDELELDRLYLDADNEEIINVVE